MVFEIEDGIFIVKCLIELKRYCLMYGFYCLLISNMVMGVLEGYKIILEVIGVGYRVVNIG